MVQFLHIVDDEKFIDNASLRFDSVAPGASSYVIIGEASDLKYIKVTKIDFMSESEVMELVGTGAMKAVIFHSMSNSRGRILSNVHTQTNVCWLGFGFDYYYSLLNSYYPKGFRQEATNNLCRSLRPSSRKFGGVFRGLVRRLILESKNLFTKGEESHSLDYSRVDYFIPVLEREYQMAMNANSKLRAKYIPWNYAVSSDFKKRVRQDFSVKPSSFEDILIGNSADPSNNHIELFEWLSKSGPLGDRKIIVPLNYGDKLYADEVCRRGELLFGENFYPLRDWMSAEDYFKLIESCGVALFGHLRQQAGASVNRTLMQGATVYMYESNPLYQAIVSRGGKIFPIAEDSRCSAVSDEAALSSADRELNWEVAQQNYEYPPNFERTQNLVNNLLTQRSNGV